ncbi:MAG: peptide-methionine (S)-S-oxide reductase MsrA [Salaquimonas sp.]
MSFAKPFFLSLALISAGASSAYAESQIAIFAGGCFWCIEKDFEHVKGVEDVVSGYTGGESDNPTYKNHVAAKHLEAVKITYDPAVVSYETLLNTFWRTVDPTDAGGQFCDRGHSYTTAVFAVDDMQRKLAEASKGEAQAALGKPIVTSIRDAAPFYDAEDYHQNYYEKNPVRYNYYRTACGRNRTVEKLWGEAAYQGVDGH